MPKQALMLTHTTYTPSYWSYTLIYAIYNDPLSDIIEALESRVSTRFLRLIEVISSLPLRSSLERDHAFLEVRFHETRGGRIKYFTQRDLFKFELVK